MRSAISTPNSVFPTAVGPASIKNRGALTWKKEKPAFIETKAGFKLYWRNFLSSAFYVWCFRTADYKFASKKLFIMEFFNCSPGFLERCHLDKREPFRALGILVANHFSVFHLADPVKEVEQV